MPRCQSFWQTIADDSLCGYGGTASNRWEKTLHRGTAASGSGRRADARTTRRSSVLVYENEKAQCASNSKVVGYLKWCGGIEGNSSV